MRSGNWRGVILALGLSCALALTAARSGRADLFHTIPDLVPAVDVNTGGPYYAPPIPYGHYTGKNCGSKLGGLLHGGLLGQGACGLCGGRGCDACGGKGGLFHHKGQGAGGPCGNGNGLCGGGHPAGAPCGSGGGLCGNGNGLCGGGHPAGAPCGSGGGKGGLFHHHGNTGYATTAVVPSAQGLPVGPCGDPGCGLFGKHGHHGKGLCGNGNGNGLCGNGGASACGSCGGKGCGLCHGGGGNSGCGACGGKGCGLCGKGMGTGCGLCGGKGCGVCAKAHGLVNHLLHRDKIKWFVGPGGPVPLTPGYTPYVVTTRSPRDFLAFPPFVP